MAWYQIKPSQKEICCPMDEATAKAFSLMSKRSGAIHLCDWCQYHKIAELVTKAEKDKLKQLVE